MTLTHTRVSLAFFWLLRVFSTSSSNSNTFLEESSEQFIDDLLTEGTERCGGRVEGVDWRAVFLSLPGEELQTFEDPVEGMDDEESQRGRSHIGNLPRLQAQTLRGGLLQ